MRSNGRDIAARGRELVRSRAFRRPRPPISLTGFQFDRDLVTRQMILQSKRRGGDC